MFHALVNAADAITTHPHSIKQCPTLADVPAAAWQAAHKRAATIAYARISQTLRLVKEQRAPSCQQR